MGDLERIAAVLTLVYAIECVVFLRRNTALLRRDFLLRWQLYHPGSTLGNARGALAWVIPLPLFPCSLTLRLPPISLSPEGALAWTPFCLNPRWRSAQTGRWVPWDQVQSVEAQSSRLLINGSLFLNACSSHEALRWAGVIRSLVKADPKARPDELEKSIANAFDSDVFDRRWDEAQRSQKWLTLQSELLFFTVFLLSPALLYKWGLSQVGWWLLGGIYFQSFLMAWTVNRAHKKLFPANGDDRFVRVLTTLLAPLSAIRAPDLLLRSSVEMSHPLIIIRSLMGEAEWKRCANHLIRDSRFPILPELPHDLPSEARTAERWWRDRWTQAMERSVLSKGLKVEQAVGAPPPSESLHRAYCPRCLAQFTDTQALCVDCGNRPVVGFPSSSALG